MTDKERLEEIKNVYEDYKELQKKRDFKQADIALLYLSENHIDWLINRIEELEMQLSINTNNMKQLQKENECYKQRVEELERENEKVKGGNFGLSKIINSKRKEIKRYKQALEFYAERNNYQWEVSYKPQQEIDCMVIDDSGHTARKALEGKK